MIALLLLVIGALAADESTPGERVLREIPWGSVGETASRAGGEILSSGELKVENGGNQPLQVEILVLDRPGIQTLHYGLVGKVRYENVDPPGYVEMWNHFPDGSAYFSRTLAESGPMGKITGTSPPRAIVLPFTSSEKTGVPRRLTVNVVLPGRGAVYLSPLRLVEYAPGTDPLSVPGAWWSDRTAGWLGGLGGAVVGLLGGLIGVLTGLGRARPLVIGLSVALVIVGVLAGVAGLVALGLRQPYGVYFPLLLLGVILSCVTGFNLPTIRRRYAEIELRRITALDAKLPK